MFADRIKELRTNNKLTQREFAERVGISPTTLVSYEKGGKVPSYDILVRIAKEFSISLDWLCETSGSKTKELPETLADVFRVFVSLISVWHWGDAMKLEEQEEVHCFDNEVGAAVCSTMYTVGFKSYNEYRDDEGVRWGSGDTSINFLNGICYSNNFFRMFDELKKMVGLIADKTITQEIFDLWVIGKIEQLKNYDVYGEPILENADNQ